ncbi:DUF1905 domain-containing protein [Novosphingobium huizhouense]|uniref:DUF1905 domain-containing protein n=1 Tax=Novosphingobium huizhouense TaxID=2866625 RepID=UPI001CD8FDF0|nr:DUF1905 domain-containing protein [Novosphingobium huizhouense]
MDETHALAPPLWRWTGGNGGEWYFVTIGGAAGEALSATALMRRLETGRRSGWGSVKVELEVGASRWSTSAFPMKDTGWIVPIKAAVRRAEGLAEDEPVALTIHF